MKGSLLSKVLIALVAMLMVVPSVVRAAPSEPNSDPSCRGLRTDYVKTWYVYNDDRLDGILNPGDTEINTFENWWTPASSHSQHNYSRDGGDCTYASGSDINSGPINYATHNDPTKENFWLGQTPTDENKNTIQFYMTYSQFDNNDWKGGYTYSTDPTVQAVVKQRHETRNGYAFGWVIHSEEPFGTVPINPQTQAGFVDMDIFVHNGRGLNPNPDGSIDIAGFGKSYSNPQVSVSNDISDKANDVNVNIPSLGPGGDRFHPPVFDDATGTYSWAANATRMTANGYNAADLTEIINSMEVEERDSLSLGAGDVIWSNRRPSEILANLFEHDGTTPYLYADAFLNDSVYHDGASDGGVIAGLAGESEYVPNPEDGGNWADQQVIRIDVSEATLRAGNIDEIVFWDFGNSDSTTRGQVGVPQVNPVPIIFYVDTSWNIDHGQIFWDPTPLDHTSGDEIYFKENRIYIAQVTIPEPATLVLLVIGAAGLMIRRRRVAR
ncbi:MAG: PEP-CTERM sorting domain-containing protein [Planctomycetota bacterium]|nr:PEP-CTERM sorting domain-containing protein [Planctomycetota bacterium]